MCMNACNVRTFRQFWNSFGSASGFRKLIKIQKLTGAVFTRAERYLRMNGNNQKAMFPVALSVG